MSRIICFLLAAVMVCSMLGAMTPEASAATKMKASSECIQLIKRFEGFLEKPVWDFSHYSVGYGTACDKDDYPDGITKKEADKLLRKGVGRIEGYLNHFAKENDLSFSQQQFDALVSFTYNIGSKWMYEETVIRSAIINGATGNDFIYAITMWSNAGGKVREGLARRRLAEANLYLNGVYSITPPENYHYVIYNYNNEQAVVDVKVQGYDANQADRIRLKPKAVGYQFVGWYTEADGGSAVLKTEHVQGDTMIYARWKKKSVQKPNDTLPDNDRFMRAEQFETN